MEVLVLDWEGMRIKNIDGLCDKEGVENAVMKELSIKRNEFVVRNLRPFDGGNQVVTVNHRRRKHLLVKAILE